MNAMQFPLVNLRKPHFSDCFVYICVVEQVVALVDLNCRARTFGHSRLNESGPILDTWIQVSDNFDVHLFTEPTRPDSQ
jgi:hypothetical protein